jgi:hypothetical protein
MLMSAGGGNQELSPLRFINGHHTGSMHLPSEQFWDLYRTSNGWTGAKRGVAWGGEP